MLPTQQISPDWLLAVLRRRMWLVILPLLFGALGGGIYASFQPNLYRSQALVLVTPPQLPTSVVRPMVTMSLRERLPMLEQEVLSRARLERIILDFDLYKSERAELTMEDVITRMRRDINVNVAKVATRRPDGLSFTLSYSSEEPRTAFRVTERLVSLFVDENARQRETIAEGTDQFLEAEVTTARTRLEETERQLETYKKQHSGQLPEQLQANVTALQNLQTQMQTLGESITRDRTELLLVQRELNDLTGASPGGEESGVVDPGPITTPYDEALAKARTQLEALELRLTSDHPDVVRQRRTVSDLEERVQAAQLRRPVTPGAPAPVTGRNTAALQRKNRLTELRQREALLTQQVANKQKDLQARQAQSAVYQSRVDAVPSREAELVSLVRDYETLKARYNTLLARSEEAKVAANMERRQVSEQFRITEPPRVPEKPYSPDRVRLTMLAAASALAATLLIIGILEYRDTTFRSDGDIVQALTLPVVAVVPNLLTADERVGRRRRRWMLAASCVTALVIGSAVLLWKLR
ncbi:chain-length determining protein [Luteitalea sp. TBR-22]|uniref:Wzz/FepE/Etk N-terminal domain-containing protein n=1 Tax=Luteitalea sp. TBR-22 TaxID=2802971 RepID=UPI001AF282AD|nr:Wzz/FepE/Etk N-terminal domain-containing protein [Luteitalea sp. TBR-22]BCS33217.1 chain-length determining protein [Luteitalea sp. TBR-22]